jgi:hypothetical protein
MFQAGQKIGRWTVISGEVDFDVRSRAFIDVRCVCGLKKTVECSSLSRHKSLRCDGCNYSSRGRAGEQNPNWKGWGIVPKTTIDTVQRKAARAALPLTPQSFTYKLPVDPNIIAHSFTSNCKVTGASITPETKVSSVVRNDISKGYTQDNVAWVSADIAPLVDKMGVTAFVNMCQQVINYQSQSLTGE